MPVIFRGDIRRIKESCARKLGKSKNSKYSRCRLKRAAFHDVITNIVRFSL